jgi:hypothetical protein
LVHDIKADRRVGGDHVFPALARYSRQGFKNGFGVCDGLVLAVDPASGAVSSYIRPDWIGNGIAAAPQFTCEFAFAGEAGEQKNVAWWPGGGPIADGATKIGGVISFKADG